MIWSIETFLRHPRTVFPNARQGSSCFWESRESPNISFFKKLIKNSLPHPWCRLFSMLSELLSASASPQEEQLRWTLRKTFQESETMQTGHRIWSSQKSSSNYFSTILSSFCVCRVGVVGVRGWLLLGWWRKEWWKEEGRIKLLKSIQVQAPTERFNLTASRPAEIKFITISKVSKRINK